MLVSDGIHHVAQGGPRARAKDLHVYCSYNFKFFSFVICSQYHTQVLQASSCVPL